MPASQPSPDFRSRAAKALGKLVGRKRLMVAFSLACSLGVSGCSTMSSLKSIASSGTWNDTVETLRNRSYSAKAWYRRQHNFCNMAHSKDFQAGFRAGYEAIADGKPGCTPSFPPKEYWSWEYQSAEGQARTAAWFEGYPYGVQAAREEGVNVWNHLQGSSECCNGGGGGCQAPGCQTPAYGDYMTSGSPYPQVGATETYMYSDAEPTGLGESTGSAVGSSSAPSVSGAAASPFPIAN